MQDRVPANLVAKLTLLPDNCWRRTQVEPIWGRAGALGSSAAERGEEDRSGPAGRGRGGPGGSYGAGRGGGRRGGSRSPPSPGRPPKSPELQQPRPNVGKQRRAAGPSPLARVVGADDPRPPHLRAAQPAEAAGSGTWAQRLGRRGSAAVVEPPHVVQPAEAEGVLDRIFDQLCDALPSLADWVLQGGGEMLAALQAAAAQDQNQLVAAIAERRERDVMALLLAFGGEAAASRAARHPPYAAATEQLGADGSSEQEEAVSALLLQDQPASSPTAAGMFPAQPAAAAAGAAAAGTATVPGAALSSLDDLPADLREALANHQDPQSLAILTVRSNSSL